MPARRPPPSNPPAPPTAPRSFRNRYDDLETQREQLVQRLRMLGEFAKPHPGYNRAMKLLNDTFRKSRLAQRLAVLQAASWLIDVLERIATQL